MTGHCYFAVGDYRNIALANPKIDARQQEKWKFGYTSKPPSTFGRETLKSAGFVAMAWIRCDRMTEETIQSKLTKLGHKLWRETGDTEVRCNSEQLCKWVDALLLHGYATSDPNKVFDLPVYDWKEWWIEQKALARPPRHYDGTSRLTPIRSEELRGKTYTTPISLLNGIIRPVLGNDITDPCTDEVSQRVVKANRALTLAQNCISYPYHWGDNVWLYPDYDDKLSKVMERMLIEHLFGYSNNVLVMLSTRSIQTKYLPMFYRYATAKYLPDSRWPFLAHPDIVRNAKPAKSPSHARCMLYFGNQEEHFRDCINKWKRQTNDTGPVDLYAPGRTELGMYSPYNPKRLPNSKYEEKLLRKLDSLGLPGAVAA